MAYQFAHMETYSRKKTDKKFSVKEILEEAARKPGACPHVPNPQPPDLIYGMDIEALEKLHDSMCDNMKETNKKGITRGIRKDQQTLGTVILSFPALQKNEDPAQYEKDFERWKKLSIIWLKEKYGDELKTIIQHTDESNPHLHAYLIPDDLKADKYNIGRCAKKEFLLSPEATGMDKKEANKLGDRRYREVWREWQDSYFDKVSVACGLTRIGSHSRRLTRKEKKQEQQQARSLAKALNETSRYVALKKEEAEVYKKKIIQEARSHADKILADADAQISEKKKVLSDIKKQISEHETKLEQLTNKPLLQKIFDKFRSQGFKQAEKELKETYQNEIDSLSVELEDTKKQITKLNHYTLKLSSETAQKETDNNKLKKQVSELKEEVSLYKKDIDTREYSLDTRPNLPL